MKIQYPGVARSIDSDVANVGALMRMSGLLPPGFEIAPYLAHARTQLREETDYLLEGRRLAEFGGLLAQDERFVVPELLEDWTTANVLTMSFVEGRPIEEAQAAPQVMRDRIVHDLIDLLLSELFSFGLMQTDPNFANYRFQPETGRIALLDFGATRAFDPAIVGAYRRLMAAGMAGGLEAQERIGEEIGFFAAATSTEHRARIVGMMDMAFAALRAPGPFDFAGTDLPDRMQREGIALAETGFVPPPLPIDVLLLQRKFGGMFLLGARLKARAEVSGLVRRYL